MYERCKSNAHCAVSITVGCALFFFAENLHYFSFIYDTEDCNITLTEAKFDSELSHFVFLRKMLSNACKEIM